MIAKIDNDDSGPRIPFAVVNGMIFFNCTQKTIDKAVENENRRRAYLRIGEWDDDL